MTINEQSLRSITCTLACQGFVVVVVVLSLYEYLSSASSRDAY